MSSLRRKSRTCSKTTCIDDGDDNKLKCTKCLKKKHYKCTNLPAYQISQFLTKGYRGYVCNQCITIPTELEMILVSQEESMTEKLKREIIGCENIILQQQEKQKSLFTAVEKFNKKSSEDEKRLNEFLEKKFESLEQKIDQSLSKNEDTCSRTFAEIVQAKSDDENNHDQSLKSFGVELRSIIAEEKAIQQKEDEERKRRSCNLIIHGASESSFDNTKVHEIFDKSYVDDLFKVIQADTVKIKRIGRIGTRAPGKNRPMKVTLAEVSDKQNIFKQLKNLKGKISYTGISITEDFTMNERKMIKKWRQKMDERNKNESKGGSKWRLRGSPRTALRLVKIDISKTQDDE